MSSEKIPSYIPKPLNDIYQFAGNWPHPRDNRDCNFLPGNQPIIFQEQDCLWGLGSLKESDGRIGFAVENQGNWICQVEPNTDDPPVFCNAGEVCGDSDGYEIVCDKLSHFLVTLCLQELVMSCKHVGTLSDDKIEESCDLELTPLWLNGYYVFKEPTHSFWCSDNKLLLMNLYGEIWYGCKDQQILQHLKEPDVIW